MRRQFDIRAWINVPPQIRDNDILYFISNRLCPSIDKEKQNHIALQEYLKDKRYLVMIDGLVNLSNWNSILQSLPDNGTGSRVMIITRLEDKEAAYADPKVHPLKINKLNPEDSEKLFRRRLLGASGQFNDKVYGSNISDDEKQSMDKACDDIYGITGGLPLAIVVLAGLLRTKHIKEWGRVLQQLKSDTVPKRIKRILALCFDDLPSRLKSCFLYFAGMLENLIIDATRLVRLWAAEGFLKPKKGKTVEDIGHNYLKELISRGMIHLVKKDINGGVWLVAIHDRLHSFALAEAQEASFLEVHDNADLLAPASVRRLYLQNYMHSYIPMDTSFPKMRSILCDFAEERSCNFEPPEQISSSSGIPSGSGLGSGSGSGSLKNDMRYHSLRFLLTSKFLRVIDLRGLRMKKLPPSIGDLIHVRYLGLQSRSLTELPSSVARLINLQTLDIERTGVDMVVQAFWEIPTLRHVIAKKLRLPNSVGLLNNMQTLTGLDCSHHPWGKHNSPLHNMVYLRYLQISGLSTKHWKGLADAFKKLESLLYLSIKGEDIPFELFTKFTLHRLQILELFGTINTDNALMEERYTLPNLSRLVLKDSSVNQTFMDKIGELPSLMELVLSDRSYEGEKLLFSDSGFNSVTNLVMSNLTELSEWEIRPMSIPKIRRIALSGCNKMKIKLDRKEGEDGLEGLMGELDEVVICNMTKDLSVEPANSAFSNKINSVTIKTKSEDITDAMQRTGRWREGMVAGYEYQN